MQKYNIQGVVNCSQYNYSLYRITIMMSFHLYHFLDIQLSISCCDIEFNLCEFLLITARILGSLYNLKICIIRLLL